MQTSSLAQEDAARLGTAMQAVWHNDILPSLAGLTGWALTVTQALDPDEFAQLVGPDVAMDAQFLQTDIARLYPVARRLDAGTAVLIPWYDEKEDTGQHLAVIDRAGVPEGAELAGWPVVVAVVGLAIGTAYVLVKYWERDLLQLAKDTAGIRATAATRIMSNAEAIRASDPAAYARIVDTLAKAQLVGETAAANPDTWLQKALTEVAGAAKTAVQLSPLLVLAFLWFMSGDSRRRAA